MPPTRREALRAAGVLGAAGTLGVMGVRPFAASAAPLNRSAAPDLVPEATATRLFYPSPAAESAIITEGLPIGNGRIGGMYGGTSAREVAYLTDSTMWSGGLNATVGSNGQPPYDSTGFGSFTMLAKMYVNVPTHKTSMISGYQRALDLSNGIVTTSYTYKNVAYRREVYASYPDDVIVIRLTAGTGGSYTGSISLSGTHGETTTANAGNRTASFGGTLANGLRYGAAVTASSTGGSIAVSGATVTFTGCQQVLIVATGGTNYVPDAAIAFKDASIDPKVVAIAKVTASATIPADTLLATHVQDYRALYDTIGVNLGTSTPAQRAQDTWTRLQARAAAGAVPDPELEASYLQFGRYLLITSSRDSVPVNLQGLWLDRNDPDWMGDYHTNINIQMNYWLAGRAGLSACFEALADYCLTQLPAWTASTQQLFNDSRNTWFRNSSGRVAGWTVATSTNVYGGQGWNWNPPGNAWLCLQLWEHYEFTRDTAYLNRIYPLLKGACEFWEARLISTTVSDPTPRTVLIDDNDWSPEHGPIGVRGITYAQELVWALFDLYGKAAATLNRDGTFAQTIATMQDKLYLPAVSPTTGWLQEWMSPDNLGETQHRHLSPLIGLFPGDRITPEGSPAALITGVRNLLIARGMDSFGWALAWRALCWSRLKDNSRPYQLVLSALKPISGTSSGTAPNFFDMYSLGSRSTFQIDGNLGVPSAMLEMILYSRAGLIELLPALPSGWTASGAVTGLPARGGFTVDLAWTGGQVTAATIRSATGGTTTIRFGTWTQQITLGAGQSITVNPPPRPVNRTGIYQLVNRRSGKAIDVPGGSATPGTALIQYTSHTAANQQWQLAEAGSDVYTLTGMGSGLLMDVDDGSTADGAPIIQWMATGSTNQQWRLVDTPDGYVKLVCVRSGKVIGVAGNSTADLAAIVQQTDTNDLSQQWQMAKLS